MLLVLLNQLKQKQHKKRKVYENYYKCVLLLML